LLTREPGDYVWKNWKQQRLSMNHVGISYFKNLFDGKREGMFVSLGNGAGLFSSRLLGEGGWMESGFTFSYDWEMGVALDQFQFFAGFRANRAFEKKTDNIQSNGLGIRYFLTSNSPSWFLSGVIGLHRFEGDDAPKHPDNQTPPGLSLSVGREWKSNWMFQIGIIASGAYLTLDPEDPEARLDFSICRVIISRVWQ
jgi:hypothetical protein